MWGQLVEAATQETGINVTAHTRSSTTDTMTHCVETLLPDQQQSDGVSLSATAVTVPTVIVNGALTSESREADIQVKNKLKDRYRLAVFRGETVPCHILLSSVRKPSFTITGTLKQHFAYTDNTGIFTC
jgi:hypothetical protein